MGMVLSTPDMQLCAGRLEKDMIQKSNMHVDGKADGRSCLAAGFEVTREARDPPAIGSNSQMAPPT
jgi:hypothetical protein